MCCDVLCCDAPPFVGFFVGFVVGFFVGGGSRSWVGWGVEGPASCFVLLCRVVAYHVISSI